MASSSFRESWLGFVAVLVCLGFLKDVLAVRCFSRSSRSFHYPLRRGSVADEKRLKEVQETVRKLMDKALADMPDMAARLEAWNRQHRRR